MKNNPEDKKILKKLLKEAGITVDGSKPYDVAVHDEAFYSRVLRYGALGVGESYMEGMWSSKQLDNTFVRVFEARLEDKIKSNAGLLFYLARNRIMNLQMGKRAYKNAQSHYDIGNELYGPMLGKTMAYTCAYWEWGAKTLDQAQTDKFELVCRKLGLKRGMKVLDTGCGWGGLSIYMAKNYGCEVVCFTPAKEQIKFIKANSKGLNIKALDTTWQDFQTTAKFDRIASIGMMEHVGPKNYRAYLTKMKSYLKEDGIMLLHTIGGNKSSLDIDPWIGKYIFPGGVLPTIKQLSTAMEGLLIVDDWHNMGFNYSKTLLCWYDNFKKSYPSLDHDKYDRRFYLMWEYYLLGTSALFRTRSAQLWQVVLSKNGVAGGYRSIR